MTENSGDPVSAGVGYQGLDDYRPGPDLAGLGLARLDQGGGFVSADQRLCDLLGYTAGELTRLTWREMVPDGEIEGASTGPQVSGFMSRRMCRRRDGTEMEVDLRISGLMDESGRPDGYILAMRAWAGPGQSGGYAPDPFVQTLKAEALSALAGGLAHEFNNILGSITGFAELATMQTAGQEPLGKYLGHIFRGGQRAKELVKQFLFFAREKEASAGQVLLVPIFKEALRFLRSALPAHVELVQEIPSAPLTILAAPLQIYLVIVGLGAWALEPLKDEGGVLEVTLNEAAFGIGDAGRRTGPWARLTVGHRRPFAGRDATRPSVDAGRVSWGRFTENGLAVLFSVVEANLGQVRMERLGEEGESWHVYFPLVEVPEEEREAIPVRDSSSRGCVLFIDKEPDLVEVASEMLRTLGYTVVAKTSCQAGLDAFRASPEAFDVVMASQFMSGMLGTELTVLLRKIRPGLPVVLSVGFDDAGFIEEARRAGVRKVLTQPVSMKDYEKALDQVLGNVRGT